MTAPYQNIHLTAAHENWDAVLSDLITLKAAGLRWGEGTGITSTIPGTPHTWYLEAIDDTVADLAANGIKSVYLCKDGPNSDEEDERGAQWFLLADDEDAWTAYKAITNGSQAYPPAGDNNALWLALAQHHATCIARVRAAYANAGLDPNEYVTVGWWNEPGEGWDKVTGDYSFHEMCNVIVPLLKAACGGSKLVSPALNGQFGFHGQTEIDWTIAKLDEIFSSEEPHLTYYDSFAVNLYIDLSDTFGADYHEAFVGTVKKACAMLEKIQADYGKPVQVHEFGFTCEWTGMAEDGRGVDHRRRGRMVVGAMDALRFLPFELICHYILWHGNEANDTDAEWLNGLCKNDGTKYATFEVFANACGVEVEEPQDGWVEQLPRPDLVLPS